MSMRNMAHDQLMAVNAVSDTIVRLWDALLSDPAGISKQAYEELSALCHFTGAAHPASGDVCERDGRVSYITDEV